MKKSRTYCSAILLAIGLQAAQAQYAEDVLRFSQFGSTVGARSQGMGNTVVGVADDYSALFGNPAGLTQQKSYEFSAGLSRLGYSNDVTFFGDKINGTNNAIKLDNLGVVYPIPTKQGGLTFAFGFGRVVNFTSIASFQGFNPTSSIIQSLIPTDNLNTRSDADFFNLIDTNIPYRLEIADRNIDTIRQVDSMYSRLNGNIQQDGIVREGGGINNWSFGGAIDIAKNLSVGVTLNFVSGTYTYDREFTETDTRNLYQVFPNDIQYWTFTNTIKSDLSGFNALFGLMYRKPGKFRFGATVRIPTTYEISETFGDDGFSMFDNNETRSASNNGETKYTVVTPLVLSGGVSVQPLDWLLLAGDAEYTDWTQMEFDTNNPDLLQENRNIKNWMRETWNLRGGVEVTLWKFGVKLRAGMEYKPSPWKNDPAEYDQVSYTGGLGLMIDENTTINASYALGAWKTFRVNYSLPGVPSASQTSESVATNTINVTFSHLF